MSDPHDAHGGAATLPAPTATTPAATWGLLVELHDPAAILAAAAKVRDAGYTKWDCHTPFPVHGLDRAMGVRPTILPWIVLGGGVTGFAAGLILQCYANGVVLPFSLLQSDHWLIRDVLSPFLPSGYGYVVSGKPLFSVPAFIPVMFELTVLLSAFGAFFGNWGLNLLPRFHHPVLTSERFRRATDDRFFISIEAADPKWDARRTREFAETLGGTHVEALEG